MKIIVTGGAGFVGSHTAKLLEKQNHKVMVLDNFSTGKLENLDLFFGEIYPCDITDRKMLEIVFSEFKPDAVLHLAAQSAISTSISDPQNDLKVNGIGTLNVLMMARKYDVKRFVFSSTSAVYDEKPSLWKPSESFPLNPNTPYGISKLVCEHYIRHIFKNHIILRYGNIYGPGQRPIGENQVIARAFKHFIFGDDFMVTGHGNQKRDFVYVNDIANCNSLALSETTIGTFNVSTGKSHSVNEVLSEIEKIYQVQGYQWAHTEENDPRAYSGLNVSAIRKNIGWKAYISLAEGLKLTAEWWEGQK